MILSRNFERRFLVAGFSENGSPNADWENRFSQSALGLPFPSPFPSHFDLFPLSPGTTRFVFFSGAYFTHHRTMPLPPTIKRYSPSLPGPLPPCSNPKSCGESETLVPTSRLGLPQ